MRDEDETRGTKDDNEVLDEAALEAAAEKLANEVEKRPLPEPPAPPS
jgi:hypothetical protein